MNIISAILTLAAILSALLAIGFLVIWFRGVKSILFPGLGFVVATPLIVALLLIVAVVIAFLALLTKSASMNGSVLRQQVGRVSAEMGGYLAIELDDLAYANQLGDAE